MEEVRGFSSPITRSYLSKFYDEKYNRLKALYPDFATRPPVIPHEQIFKMLHGMTPSNTKLTCCDFSSDGMFLAIGGREKRVALYEVELFKSTKMATEHSNVITDLRFSPNLTMFATSSLDKTVLIWDAKKSGYRAKIEGNGPVFSLDFSHRVPGYMCFSDSSEDIQFWCASEGFDKPILDHTMKGCMKGGNNKQVRFQREWDYLLAAVSGKTINVISFDDFKIVKTFQGEDEFRSICWSLCGNYIGSVSKDRAQIWCLRTGKCLSELKSDSEHFESCCMRPVKGSTVMAIGCSKKLIFWNPFVDETVKTVKTMTFDAHEDTISCITSCSTTEMMASASHDHTVKLWC